jgi:hypothetical protein
MIATIGLLTAEGLDNFYAIFDDYENISDKSRKLEKYLCNELAPYENQKANDKIKWAEKRKTVYKAWLKKVGAKAIVWTNRHY